MAIVIYNRKNETEKLAGRLLDVILQKLMPSKASRGEENSESGFHIVVFGVSFEDEGSG